MFQIKVSGMTCDHCVAAVSKAVKEVPNVENVSVDLERGTVTVDGSVDAAAVRNAIAEEGYEVQEAST